MGHLNHHDVRLLPVCRKEQLVGPHNLRRVVLVQDCIALRVGDRYRVLNRNDIGLAPGRNDKRKLSALPVELRNVDVDVLVDCNLALRPTLRVGDEVLPFAFSPLFVSDKRTVPGFQTPAPWGDPDLDEPERLLRMFIVLRMHDARTRRHVLHRTAGESLDGPHAVLVRQVALHYVRTHLHVPVWVFAKPTLGLNEVVVEYSENPEIRIGRVKVLREAEVKPALQPVPVGPGVRRGLRVRAVAKHVRLWLGHAQPPRGNAKKFASHWIVCSTRSLTLPTNFPHHFHDLQKHKKSPPPQVHMSSSTRQKTINTTNIPNLQASNVGSRNEWTAVLDSFPVPTQI
mmetsp:Transcript_1231/g.3270  ORF Transcript_1231/g.3270 Transcript_1231/m.3270 type:complete len:342 (+) Transcript_1231:53-1078(+)